MDNVERQRRSYGEYENEEGTNEKRESGRLREIIERLRDEDNRQNHRLQTLENEIITMRTEVQSLWNSHNRIEVALIGHDGKNGMRSTMVEHYASANGRLDQVTNRLDRLAGEVSELTVTTKTIAKLFGGLSAVVGVAGIVVAIVNSF